jgi:hypothetical protein
MGQPCRVRRHVEYRLLSGAEAPLRTSVRRSRRWGRLVRSVAHDDNVRLAALRLVTVFGGNGFAGRRFVERLGGEALTGRAPSATPCLHYPPLALGLCRGRSQRSEPTPQSVPPRRTLSRRPEGTWQPRRALRASPALAYKPGPITAGSTIPSDTTIHAFCAEPRQKRSRAPPARGCRRLQQALLRRTGQNSLCYFSPLPRGTAP